ncbi:MAG: hypothetical protein ACKPFG_18525 [Planktothrix sp.]|uniref:hypothetical protein n=1 Tax=Planktothrix sp. TaxID=3088171 RepID=UPI0038D3ECB4
MTFRDSLPEIKLLKNLRYNHYYDVAEPTNGHSFDSPLGSRQQKSKLQPFIEAFSTSEEYFNFELEIMTVERGENGKPVNLIPSKQIIQLKGLGIPNPNPGIGVNNQTTKKIRFIEYKLVASEEDFQFDGTYYGRFGEYWSDNLMLFEDSIPIERSVDITINKIGLKQSLEGGAYYPNLDPNYAGATNTFWENTIAGQVLDIACFLP